MHVLNEDLSTCEPKTKDLCFKVYGICLLIFEGVLVQVCTCGQMCVQVNVFVYEGHTCGGSRTVGSVAP